MADADYMTTEADLPGEFSVLYRTPMTLLWDNSGFTSTIAYMTTLTNQADFVLAIGGDTPKVIPTAYGNISRHIPLSHPIYYKLLADKVECEAFGEPSADSEALIDLWSHCSVKVTFRSVPFGISGDEAFSEWNQDQGSQYITIPGRKFKFPDGEPLDQDAGSFATINQYSLTLYNCPSQNDTVIGALASTYNNAVFMGRPVGSLLFVGAQGQSRTAIGGVTRWQRTLSFMYRSHHWNLCYKSSGVLDTPVDPAGNPLYQGGDWSQLRL